MSVRSYWFKGVLCPRTQGHPALSKRPMGGILPIISINTNI